MSKQQVGVIVGSLRQGSFSKAVAQYVATQLSEAFDVFFIDISDLPIYNQDLDAGDATPAAWTRFRADVAPLDAVLFVTPEYNRSMPGVLKNALDVGSRPYGASVWAGKPGAVISVSPGAIGAFGANHHLRQVATFLDIALMQQPEAYVGNIVNALSDGVLTDEGVQGFLTTFAQAFTQWVRRLSA
ncbi:MAG: NAD(P)H-dependent oxidoreductase [Propionibacteriaceae bacterium]|nr:NAD(P)H-dependent oxidoreductase [Propionibacteriaceae bacterium]